MNFFEDASHPELTTDALMQRAHQYKKEDPELSELYREAAVRQIARLLKIDEPAARGVAWDMEDELEGLNDGQA